VPRPKTIPIVGELILPDYMTVHIPFYLVRIVSAGSLARAVKRLPDLDLITEKHIQVTSAAAEAAKTSGFGTTGKRIYLYPP
jgi:hypothetical protein